MQPEVLVVEDDASLREVLQIHLRGDGLTVRSAGDAESALALSKERLPHVAVIDVMLPGRSGLEVCAHLRDRSPSIGIVVLTARGEEADVLMGFDAGADDYVLKPCRPRELVARVRALLRRIELPQEDAGEIVRGALRVVENDHAAFVHDTKLTLTPTEFTLLHLLAASPGKAHARMDLLEAVWNTRHPGYARNVDCHVARLRRKLQAAGLEPSPITTVHGLGYTFEVGA